jgi:hypothetical protein
MNLILYTDNATGVQARIAVRTDGRYAVTVLDLDANEVLPVAKIFSDFASADALARQIVGGAV